MPQGSSSSSSGTGAGSSNSNSNSDSSSSSSGGYSVTSRGENSQASQIDSLILTTISDLQAGQPLRFIPDLSQHCIRLIQCIMG